jgi:PAS domain S-box-containing protein
MQNIEDQNSTWPTDDENEGKGLNKKVLLIAISIFIFSLSGILFFLTTGNEKGIEGEEIKAHVLNEIGFPKTEPKKIEEQAIQPESTATSTVPAQTEATTPEKTDNQSTQEEVKKEDVIPQDIFDENGEFVFSPEIFTTYSSDKIEEIFRKILNDNENPIISLDTGTVITFLSDEYTELTGFSLEDLKGKTFFSNINPEDLQSTLSSITQLSIKGTPNKIGPYRITTKTGVTQMHIASAAILKDKDDKPAQIILAVQNVSDKISSSIK